MSSSPISAYHIIQLTDIRAPKQASFEEMRPSLEADLKTQQAQERKFAEWPRPSPTASMSSPTA